MRSSTGLALLVSLVLAGCGGARARSTDSSVTIGNGSRIPIYSIYFSPVGDMSWGADMLAGDVLETGETQLVYDIACGYWDVRIIDASGADCVLSNVAICDEDSGLLIEDGDLALCGGLSTGGEAGSTVTIGNASRIPIGAIFFSPVGDMSWGPDLLAGDVLYTGEEQLVYDIECGAWDIRIVDVSGADCVLSNIGICDEDSGLLIEDGDLAVCSAFGG